MNLLHLSWKNLRFRPLSMTLSTLLFALGIGLVSLLFILQQQLQKNFEQNLAGIDLVVGAKGSPLQMILSSMYHIDAPTGNISLQEARPFLNPKHPLIAESIPLSLGDSYKGYRIVGTTPDFLKLYNVTFEKGRMWAANFEVTVGAEVAKTLHLHLGDTFSSSHGFEDEDDFAHDHTAFIVVGILAPSGTVADQLILTTTQSFWLVHEHNDTDAREASETNDEHAEHEHDDHHDHNHATADREVPLPDGPAPKSLLEEPGEKEITSVLVKFKGRNYQALNMQRNINENTDLQAATPAIEINRLYALMNTGEQALRILALVIIFVSALSIFISLYASLKERKYELALMRVMGATPSKIFLLIIFEGLILAVLGYIAGIGLSHFSLQWLGGMFEDAYRYQFSAWSFMKEEGYLFVASLLIGFIAAILPAMQASRTDISDTLAEG